ncbi:MAG: hypothetical protein ABSF14_23035 [Terriglobia bacterium]|jgi:hypothetical protein
MRRSLFLLFLSTAILLGLSMTAFAGSLTLTFQNVAGTNAGGVYTGIYYGTLNGGPQQNFMCDDYHDHIGFGESWDVKTYNINDLSGVTFGTSGNVSSGMPQLQAYAEALYIAQGLFKAPLTGDPQASTDSFAIWTLLDSTVQAPMDITGALSGAENWWETACNYGDPTCLSGLSNVTIYVPTSWTGADRPQEFLGDPTPTPEPLSVILMGSFLSLAGGVLGRKKRAL